MVFRRSNRPVPPPAQRALARARRFLQIGRFGKAAALLAELANQVETAGRPKAAAELHARAAYCYIEAGIASAALAESEFALVSFQQAGLAERFARFYGNIARKMQAHGMQDGAGALRARFGAETSLNLPGPQAVTQGKPLILPAACPQCGAPARSDEIEWIDARSAECAYCGAIIAAQ
jgi:hypothetical protein